MNLISDGDNIFSFLNCKFIGNNKLIFMNILYSSLGVYLDLFGTFIIIFSLFIFIGIVFILIIIKNNKKDKKDLVKDLKVLSDIWEKIEIDDENNPIVEETDKDNKKELYILN